MTSPSPSTPSEGEIVESDSEKATTSLLAVNGTNVDRQFRKRISVSRSPSPIQSPKYHISRTRSRSPYREPRGLKRLRDDDEYTNHRNDPRRFKVHYEGRSSDGRRRSIRSYDDLDRSGGPDPRLPYDERSRIRRARDRRSRTRSRSAPRSKPSVIDQSRSARHDKSNRLDFSSRRVRGDDGYRESNKRLSREQSVSDRGHSPIAAVLPKREAEIKFNQKQQHDRSALESRRPAKYVLISSRSTTSNITCVRNTLVQIEDSDRLADVQSIDEATLIEERRKRRAAIKAKHRGQATPLLVQTLDLNASSIPATPKPHMRETQSQVTGMDPLSRFCPVTDSHVPESPRASPQLTPKDTSGQESPTAFVVLKDADLANGNFEAGGEVQEDEPSAADYDPTKDMQEDKIRHDQRHHGNEVSSSAYDETKTVHQDVLLPNSAIEKPRAKKPGDEFDMFADDDDIDMFAEAPAGLGVDGTRKEAAKAIPLPLPQAKALDMSMLDDWDDQEGYYKVILGELLDNRYHVQSNLGKGMFSGVVRAMDQKNKRLVAIKLIRNNETM